MASPRTYWVALRNTRNAVATRLGCDVTRADVSVRAISGADLACVVVLVKALTDKGVITDAELSAAQAAVLADVWDVEPPLQ